MMYNGYPLLNTATQSNLATSNSDKETFITLLARG